MARADAKTAQAKLSEWDAHRIDAEIVAGMGKSGMTSANHADAASLLRGELEVKEGKVVTKAAPGVIPGQTVD
jgi:hypothetical protein